MLKRDESTAHGQLKSAPFSFGFSLRQYQRATIQVAEPAIETGKPELLAAMATGTGKTKTCIGRVRGDAQGKFGGT